jgi:Bacteriocin-protection, YdeI or OmpD-Associated/Domain of unknown function (DUF1905)
MKSLSFTAELMTHGKTATGFVVPESVVEQLGSSRKPAVKVTINGVTYRSTIAFMGGQFLLGVSAENRSGTGISAGDTVTVKLELDVEKREVTIADDFAKALAKNKKAKETLEKFSFSHQRAYVDWVESAKKDETRKARIVSAIEMLAEGKKRV